MGPQGRSCPLLRASTRAVRRGDGERGCPQGAQGSEPMRLAFCSDNRILCESLATAMETCGHQVVAITTNAADGLATVEAHRPDAVLLDLRMPEGAGGNGTDSAEGLRAPRGVARHVPATA